jgi:hypothetical protein
MKYGSGFHAAVTVNADHVRNEKQRMLSVVKIGIFKHFQASDGLYKSRIANYSYVKHPFA